MTNLSPAALKKLTSLVPETPNVTTEDLPDGTTDIIVDGIVVGNVCTDCPEDEEIVDCGVADANGDVVGDANGDVNSPVDENGNALTLADGDEVLNVYDADGNYLYTCVLGGGSLPNFLNPDGSSAADANGDICLTRPFKANFDSLTCAPDLIVNCATEYVGHEVTNPDTGDRFCWNGTSWDRVFTNPQDASDPGITINYPNALGSISTSASHDFVVNAPLFQNGGTALDNEVSRWSKEYTNDDCVPVCYFLTGECNVQITNAIPGNYYFAVLVGGPNNAAQWIGNGVWAVDNRKDEIDNYYNDQSDIIIFAKFTLLPGQSITAELSSGLVVFGQGAPPYGPGITGPSNEVGFNNLHIQERCERLNP